jgi:hypothetical protein
MLLANDGQAFNTLARSDNVVIKSITVLTIFFLPATFFSVSGRIWFLRLKCAHFNMKALFSTTFFTFGDDGWEVSDKIWLYWAVTVPTTVIVLLIYNLFVRGPGQDLREYLRRIVS